MMFILSLGFACPLHAQTAGEYYKQGLFLKEFGKYDEAIKVLEKAVIKDRKFADAFYAIGMSYLAKDSVNHSINARMRSDNAFKNAVRYAENDLQLSQYYTGWADNSVLQGYFSNAKKYYLKAIELDDKNRDAKMGIVQVVKGDIAEAVKYLDDVLKLEPGHSDALKVKGMLYFERIPVSRVNSRFTISVGDSINVSPVYEFMKIFEEYTEIYPEDPDGFLSYGLGYQYIRDYENASINFSIAKSLISDEENAQYEDTKLLKVGGLFRRASKISVEEDDTEKFWYQRDPMFLTDINEREIEHYSRVAEAKLRFSNPYLKRDGAETIQGKILIKYGRPNREANIDVSLNLGRTGVDDLISVDYSDNINLTVRSSPVNRIERPLSVNAFYSNWWYYDGFKFKFEKGLLPNSPWRFGIDDGAFINYTEEAKRLEKRLPESYTYISKGRFIDFAYDYATFRGISGATYLELYYAVPVNRLVFENRQGMMVGEYKTGIFLHDSLWNKSLEDVNSETAAISLANFDANSDEVFVGKYDYQVMPNNYFLSFEMMDLNSDNTGVQKDTLKIEGYGYDRLQMSDIQLAWNIEIKDINKLTDRTNLVINPNPRRFYNAGQPIYIYYEIYNLDLSEVNGTNDYTLEYSLEYIETGDFTVSSWLKDIFFKKERQRLTTEFSTKNDRRDEPAFLQIDHNITKPGPYRLTIKVTDNLSNSVVEKSTVLRIIGENK